MHSNDTFPRRTFLATAVAGAVVGSLAGPVRALSVDTATNLVQRIVDETLQIVDSNVSSAQAYKSFEQILARYGDIPVIARSVLGQPWRTASPAQQKAFIDAFQGYIARKYGAEFREYRGSSMKINSAKDMGNKGVLVNTIVKIPGEAPFAVDWQVSDRSGQAKMINLYIEGISMLSTERSEVRAILESNRNDIDGLIQDLRKRG